jgi:tetratricopeptide (TPR) repeat protein
MNRLFARLLLFMLAASVASGGRPAGAERTRAGGATWVSVRSQNFLVVGAADERELRGVAVRLEAYRAAFSRLLSGEHFDAGVPTAVVVFADDASYAPFRPRLRGQVARGVAGYFQPGTDVNYITLAREGDLARDPSTLLHEYTHLLVNNHFRAAPLWLKEGLAEFYSTARLSSDGRRLSVGRPPDHRARALRGRELLPLATLFAVDQSSTYYTEPAQRAIFYAQSWALVHYLSEARGGDSGLARFTNLLAAGVGVEDALRQAFGVGVEEVEAGLAAYVRLARYRMSDEELGRPLDFDSQLTARALTEAEVAARLGDLLLHTEREEEAEAYLLRAVASDPRLAAARVSLGALRLRQNRAAEARAQLQQAVESDPRDHLAHYLLADALNREGTGGGDAGRVTFKEFEERTEAIRASLRRAIELAPAFVESYKLLATVELERGDRPEEAAALLARASTLAPRRADLALLRAQALMLSNHLEEAERLAGPFAEPAREERVRAQAAALLKRIVERREQAAAARAEPNALPPGASAPAAQPCDMPVRGGPQYKRLRFEGAQVCGRLAEIECADAGAVVFRVETDAGTLRLRAEDLRGVRFVTYTAAVKTGSLSCGPREHADHVLVTYRTRRDERQPFDGEAIAVEFIPDDWNP